MQEKSLTSFFSVVYPDGGNGKRSPRIGMREVRKEDLLPSPLLFFDVTLRKDRNAAPVVDLEKDRGGGGGGRKGGLWSS